MTMSTRMEETYKKIKEKIEEIHEGLQNLKERTDFQTLMHRNRLWEVISGIDQFSDHNRMEGLQNALSTFRETAGLHPEGVNAYNVTIWDANVQARGRMTTLAELFGDLEELVSQYYKEK